LSVQRSRKWPFCPVKAAQEKQVDAEKQGFSAKISTFSVIATIS
jgi:hypothetical protein